MRKPHEDLREAVLAEAGRLLEVEGARALSARRLAAAAGCSVGTLYNIFEHLDGVVRAVNRETMKRLAAALAEADPGEGAGRAARLEALGQGYLAYGVANPARWELLFRYRLDTPAEALPAELSTLLALLRSVAGPGPSDEALIALWAAVHGVVELAVARRLPNAAEGAEGRMIALVIEAGIRGLAAEGFGRDP
ncbi:MAG: TetR-like C-terminal domain-containing protein [Pseudomonadota bacterium]